MERGKCNCGGNLYLENIKLAGESWLRMVKVCEKCRKIHTIDNEPFTIETTDEPAYYYVSERVIGESTRED